MQIHSVRRMYAKALKSFFYKIVNDSSSVIVAVRP